MLRISHPAPETWQVVDEAGVPEAIACTITDAQGTPISKLVTTWRTMEEAQAALEARLEWTYYTSLKTWLRSIRVCPTCATLMSFAKVERWAGRAAYDWKAARGECAGVPCTTCPDCVSGALCAHPITCESLAIRHADRQPQPPCDHPKKPAAKKEQSHAPTGNTRAASAPRNRAATA